MTDSRFFRFSFLAAMLALPLYRGGTAMWYFAAIAAVLALLALAEALFSVKRTGPVWSGSRLLDVLFLLYISALTAVSIFSDLPYRSAIEVYKLAALYLVFRMSLAFCRDRSDVRSLASWLVFLGGGLSLYGLVQYLGGLPSDWWHRPRQLAASFVNHNHFAGFLEIAIPVAIGLAICEKTKSKKILYLFTAAVMAAAFALSGSRAGALALLAALVFMAALLVRCKAAGWAGFVAFALPLLAAAGVLAFNFEWFSQRLMPTRERFFIWDGAWGIVSKHFWMGTGPGTFEYAFLKFRPVGFPYRPVHAHNDYLEVLADGGILLFISAVVLFGAFFIRGLRVIANGESRTRAALGSAFLAAFLSLALHGIVDFNFHIPANIFWLATSGAMLLALDRKAPPAPRSASLFERGAQSLAASAILAASLFFAVSDFLFFRARSAWESGDTPRAISKLDRAIALNPWEAGYRDLRGYIRMKTSHDPKESALAAADISEAVKLNPYEPYYSLHYAQLAAGTLKKESPDKVIPYFQAAIRKDPRDARLCIFVAKLFLELENRNQKSQEIAIDLLGQAVEADPLNSYSIFEILWKIRPEVAFLKSFQARYPQGIADFVRFLAAKGHWNEIRPYYLARWGVDAATKEKLSRTRIWKTAETRSAADFARSKKFVLKKSPVRIVWTMSAKPSGGVYPFVAVSLNGKALDAFYLNSLRPKAFHTAFEVGPGEYEINLLDLNGRVFLLEKIEVQYADA